MNEDTSVQASVKTRLLKISRNNQEDYNQTLLRYVSERFLYRLGQSAFKNDFVLKGAYLLSVTFGSNRYRSTRDIDFLKIGNTDAEYLRTALQEIAAVSGNTDDGVRFDRDSISLTEIRSAQLFHGQRAKMTAYIGRTRIVLQLDIGVGDAVIPKAERLTIPTLLDQSTPEVSAYPIEAVIAEKLEAVISIGILTSRMKDFYDLYIITKSLQLDLDIVKISVYNTFQRRQTSIPNIIPEVLSESTARNPDKQIQWKAFITRIQSEHVMLSFEEVLKQIRQFACDVFNLT